MLCKLILVTWQKKNVSFKFGWVVNNKFFYRVTDSKLQTGSDLWQLESTSPDSQSVEIHIVFFQAYNEASFCFHSHE